MILNIFCGQIGPFLFGRGKGLFWEWDVGETKGSGIPSSSSLFFPCSKETQTWYHYKSIESIDAKQLDHYPLATSEQWQ